jgi:methylated-DNA-[protein]-cysteine S-methyltransferase
MKLPHNTEIMDMESPLGRLHLAAAADKLVGVWFDAQTHLPDLQSYKHAPKHPVLLATADQIAQFFVGQRLSFELPLDLSTGTTFQQSVWQALLSIPRGQTSTYKAVCLLIGKPAAMRALGGAVGRNPLSIIVPCHRVLGAHGALTGYAGGLARKTALLQLEGAL